MTRLYAVCTLLALCGAAATATAQTVPAPAPVPAVESPSAAAPDLREEPPAILETNLPASVLAAMPSTGSLYSILESMQPDYVSNRIEGGGLYTGTAAHVGAHGSSWTATQFRVGDINITDPDGSGTPLLLPGVFEWDRVDVNTGIMGIDVNAPGLVINLTPRRPSSTWIRTVEGAAGPPALQAGRGTVPSPPTIAHLDSYLNGSVFLSGPVNDRLGVVFAGSYTQSTRLERASATPLDGALASAFAHLVYAVSPRDEVRTVLWLQRAGAPPEHRVLFTEPTAQQNDTMLSAQSTWERKGGTTAASWRGFASFSLRNRTQDASQLSSLTIERVVDGPPWEQVNPGPGTDRRWQIGARVKPLPRQAFNRDHDLTLGADVSGGAASQSAWFNGTIGELVNGIPARVWRFYDAGTGSQWHQTTLAAYAADRVMLTPRLTGTAGLRFEHVGGSADGAATGISWNNFLPRLGLRWDLTEDRRLDWFANYGRYGYDLRLRDLAYGDPNAGTALAYRWLAPIGTSVVNPTQIGQLVERWGPGTGQAGSPGITPISAIDADLSRPYMDEFVTGFEFRPTPAWVTRLSGIARRDKSLMALTNAAVPFSAYSKSFIVDPGVDVSGGTTAQPLPIYSRPSSTFGRDQYLLTNNNDIQSTFTGVDATVQLTTDKLFLLIGGTAGRSEGWASNIGFHDNENDIAVIGDVFVNPNSYTYAKARVFTERGYTLHASGVYHFPHDISLGMTARYQDGEHFARLVVASDLPQGAEFVRAFGNGRTRFTFTGTLDARLQKGFDVSGHRVEAFFDAFNLLNLAYQVEEYTVTGPASRLTSAVQPPFAMHLGVRVGF